MPSTKISLLTSYSNPDPANDVLPIVDTTNSTTKKISRNNLLGITSAPVGINDTQTLTNKTLTAPTLTSAVFNGTITGTYTLAGTPTFPATVVTLAGTQTLTNKTLTSPTISAPTITNASITADSISGFTTANTGTIYGLPVTTGTISGASLTAGTVGASTLSTSAIKLGYAPITTAFTTASTSFVQVTGLTSTVTVPSGGRSLKITVYAAYISNSLQSQITTMTIWDGTVGSGTQIQGGNTWAAGNNFGIPLTMICFVTPSPGTKTYNIGMAVSAGTGAAFASVTSPSFILVELI